MSFFLHSAIPGYVLAILGILASVYFGKKSKRFKKILYYKETKWIIIPGKTAVPNLHIHYREKEVNELSTTYYTIWNGGNETIQKEDVVASRPLTIRAVEGAILDAQIINKSEESCMCSLDTSDDSILVQFDYFDPTDGVVLRIIHSGDVSDLDGKIKGSIIEPFNTQKQRKRIIKLGEKVVPRINTLLIEGVVGSLFFLLVTVLLLLRISGIITESSALYQFLFISRPASRVELFVMFFTFLFMTIVQFRLTLFISRKQLQIGIPKSLRLGKEQKEDKSD